MGLILSDNRIYSYSVWSDKIHICTQKSLQTSSEIKLYHMRNLKAILKFTFQISFIFLQCCNIVPFIKIRVDNLFEWAEVFFKKYIYLL